MERKGDVELCVGGGRGEVGGVPSCKLFSFLK
jgi:hypothetical protein